MDKAFSQEKIKRTGVVQFHHKEFKAEAEKKEPLKDLLPSSQLGIILVCAISYSGKTTFLKNMIDSILSPFRTKKNNPDYNKLKDKEIFIFIVTTSYGTDMKITKLIDSLREYKHPKITLVQYDKFEDQEYQEMREVLEDTEKDPDYNFPQNIIIFDDARAYLKSKNLSELSTRFRHTQSLCFLSCHDFKDVPLNSRNNAFYCVLFKNIDNDRLEEIRKMYLGNVDFETFKRINEYFLKQTGQKGDFLFIDRERGTINKNLTENIIFK